MNGRDDKSMDDVLASIRRIVRAEKESGVADAPGDEPHDGAGRHSGADEPLVLTPDMRTDLAEEPGPARPELAADTAGAPAGQEPADREAVRAVLRDLLREELAGGPAGEAVRTIIRDELVQGQIGRNISQNVVRIVREEVARATRAPG